MKSDTPKKFDRKPSDRFGSLIFLDFESTGLPFMNPRITEVALVGIQTKDWAALTGKWTQRWTETGCRKAPFVTREDLMAFSKEFRTRDFLVNPMGTPTTASWLNGITDEMLKYEPFFADRFPEILSFLRQFPKPHLLVAHNGYRFDFPLLAKEIRMLQEEESPRKTPPDGLVVESSRSSSASVQWTDSVESNVFCFDGMVGARHIERDWYVQLNQAARDYVTQCHEKTCALNEEGVAPETDDKSDENDGRRRKRSGTNKMPGEKQKREDPDETRKIAKNDGKVKLPDSYFQTLPFVDPQLLSRAAVVRLSNQVLDQVDLDYASGKPPGPKRKFVKRTPKTGSFSEGKLYGELFPESTPPNHRALNDVIGMVNILLAYGDEMARVMLTESKPFSEVKPMNSR